MNDPPRIAPLSRCIDSHGLNSAPIELEDNGQHYPTMCEILLLLFVVAVVDGEPPARASIGRNEAKNIATGFAQPRMS